MLVVKLLLFTKHTVITAHPKWFWLPGGNPTVPEMPFGSRPTVSYELLVSHTFLVYLVLCELNVSIIDRK
jgi:hypothetical protein